MLKIEEVNWTSKEGENKIFKKMKILGKLMDKTEVKKLVSLVDRGLEVQTIKYKDKKTGEDKTFDIGKLFCAIQDDETENNGFTAEFTGQALKEIIHFNEKNPIGKGTRFGIVKAFWENKKTGATYPIIKVVSEEDVLNSESKPTTEQQSEAKKIMETLYEEPQAVNPYEYTEKEEQLIKLVKEKNETLEVLMFNLKKLKEASPNDVKDLNEERFKVRLQ